MKNFNIFVLTLFLYETLCKDNKQTDISIDKIYIEDEEFVYSKIEENNKLNDKKDKNVSKSKSNILDKPIKNVNNNNDKDSTKETINVLDSYPSLNLGLDDLIKIVKKLSFDRSDIPLLWEYFLNANSQKMFDFFNSKKKEKNLFPEDSSSLPNEQHKNSNINNYSTFSSIDLNYLYSYVHDENTVMILLIHFVSIFIYIISSKFMNYAKFSLLLILVSLIVNYLFMDFFYSNKYYFSSFITYFILIFMVEKLWNNLFCIEYDYEIQDNLNNENSLFDPYNFNTKEKFIRKAVILMIILFFSIYITFTKYRGFYFYIFQFYIYRVLRLIFIRYFKYNSIVSCELQPFENFIDIVIGSFCLLISNWYYYISSSESQELFGFIIIYNIISFYYITSLDKFLYIYRNGLSDIYFEYMLFNEKNSENKQHENSDSNRTTNLQEKDSDIDKDKKLSSSKINNKEDIPQSKSSKKNKKQENKLKSSEATTSANKNSDDSSDDEVITLENLRKFESFQELVDKINLKRYYRIDVFNIGNIVDVVLVTIIFIILILSFALESIFLLFLSIYLINVFMKNNAIYISTKISRLISHFFQILLMINIYNSNFHSLEFLNILTYKGVEINNFKVTIKLMIKFLMFCLAVKSLFINYDFLAYFNIYYYSSYKFIQQEGVNIEKINENSELMFRIKEVYNYNSVLEEIFTFDIEKSYNYINYIFENCKFSTKKNDYTMIEYSLDKSSKNYNILFLVLDYFSLYFCYWLTYFVFKDSHNIFFYALYILFKVSLVIKFFFLIFEYSKSSNQKYTTFILNTIFYNRIISYFEAFYFDYYSFIVLSYINKFIYIYYFKNSFFVNVFLTLLEFIEFRKCGNYLSFIVILTALCSKSFLYFLGKTKRKTKFIVTTSIYAFISCFIFTRVDKFLFILYDSLQEKMVKNFKIDWIGIIEYFYFNSIKISQKYSDRGLTDSYRNCVFVEALFVREFLKYLIKLKLFVL